MCLNFVWSQIKQIGLRINFTHLEVVARGSPKLSDGPQIISQCIGNHVGAVMYIQTILKCLDNIKKWIKNKRKHQLLGRVGSCHNVCGENTSGERVPNARGYFFFYGKQQRTFKNRCRRNNFLGVQESIACFLEVFLRRWGQMIIFKGEVSTLSCRPMFSEHILHLLQ